MSSTPISNFFDFAQFMVEYAIFTAIFWASLLMTFKLLKRAHWMAKRRWLRQEQLILARKVRTIRNRHRAMLKRRFRMQQEEAASCASSASS